MIFFRNFYSLKMCGSKFYSLFVLFAILCESSYSTAVCSDGNGVQGLPTDINLENKTFIIITSYQRDHEPNDLFSVSFRDHSICATYQILLGEENLHAYLEVLVKDPMSKFKTRNYFFYNNNTRMNDFVEKDEFGKIKIEDRYELFGISSKDVLVVKRCVTDSYNKSKESMIIFIPILSGGTLLNFSLREIVKMSLLTINATTIKPKMFPTSIDNNEGMCGGKDRTRFNKKEITAQLHNFQEAVRLLITVVLVMGMISFLMVICIREKVWSCGPGTNLVSPI